MEFYGRRYYHKGEILRLKRENMTSFEEWEILDKIGEGGSSVCYTAKTGAKKGRLKTYSPANIISSRHGIEDFISAYKVLESAKQKDQRYEILNNYLAYYELLFSVDEKDNINGAFIWTPDDKIGTDFGAYLANIRNSKDINQLSTLLDILKTIYTLTDCVCLLHSSGILHLDLKPSNFLVTYDSHMGLNTGNISLFDINSIYSIESENTLAVGTDGYCAPEVDKGYADNRSDIYSIGAILFNSIADINTVPEGLYRAEYYDRLDSIVEESPIVGPLKGTVSDRAITDLIIILKRTLARRPGERYDYAELLLDDLKKVIEQLGSEPEPQKQSLKLNGKASYIAGKAGHIAGKIAAMVLLVGIVLALSLGIYHATKLPKETNPENTNNQTNINPENTDNQIAVNPENTDNQIAVNPVNNDEAATSAATYSEFHKLCEFMEKSVSEKKYIAKTDISIPAGSQLIIPEDKVLSLENGAGLILEADSLEGDSEPYRVIVYGSIECDTIDRLVIGENSYGSEKANTIALAGSGRIDTDSFRFENKPWNNEGITVEAIAEEISCLQKGSRGYMWNISGDLSIIGENFDSSSFMFYSQSPANRVLANGEGWAIDNTEGTLCELRYSDYYERIKKERYYTALKAGKTVDEYYSAELNQTQEEVPETIRKKVNEWRNPNDATNVLVFDEYLIGQGNYIDIPTDVCLESGVWLFPSDAVIYRYQHDFIYVIDGGKLVFENAEDLKSMIYDSGFTFVLAENTSLIVGDVTIYVPVIEDHLFRTNYAYLRFSNDYESEVVFEVWGRCKVKGTMRELKTSGLDFMIPNYALVVYNPGLEFEDNPADNYELSLNDLDRFQSEMFLASWSTEFDDIRVLETDKSYDIMSGETLAIPRNINLHISEGTELRVHPGGQISYEGSGDIINKERIIYLE